VRSTRNHILSHVAVADEEGLYLNVSAFFNQQGLAMKRNKRSFVVSVLFTVLSFSTGILDAHDADLAPLTFAAARTAKQQCINTCRARYRDCLAKKQIPSFECQNVYQDCTRLTCNGLTD
jgi:hypothetical protein